MKIYQLTRKQFLPVNLKHAWDFFSSPKNLALITPSGMAFKILSYTGAEKMFKGQLIHYRITILPAITVRWVTEITEVNEPYQFTDEQRSGPYALWQHRHRFTAVQGGVEIVDELKYAIPMGWIGRLAHLLFVNKKVKAIFDFRYSALEKRFGRLVSSTEHRVKEN
ncbi:MAG TPA: SRPBCC family protein [Chryseolinea sp.]|jgi:ligand-binding SRPBCC domain-containing protein|nr:SRPBCC family protein [Chryseolinea sp.]